MESLSKDKVTTTDLPSPVDSDASNLPAQAQQTGAISSVARILGKATRSVVEDVKKPLKVPKKIKEIFTQEIEARQKPEPQIQVLEVRLREERKLREELKAQLEVMAAAIAPQGEKQAETQRQAIETLLMQEQKAREEAEKSVAEAEATAQQELKLKEHLEAQLEAAEKSKNEAIQQARDAELLQMKSEERAEKERKSREELKAQLEVMAAAIAPQGEKQAETQRQAIETLLMQEQKAREEAEKSVAEAEATAQRELKLREQLEARLEAATATVTEAEQRAKQAEAQREAVEARLMEEQEAREATEKRVAEVEATAEREFKLREQLEAKLEVEETEEEEAQIQLEAEEEAREEETKGEPEPRREIMDVESLRGGITGKGAYEHVLIENAKKELSSESVEVRCAAIRALRQLGHVSVPILVETLSKDPSDDVRLNTLASLIALSDKSTLPTLVKCLKDDNPRIRLEAVRGLYQVGDEDSVPFLIEALNDEHDDVRRRAATYLGRVESETVAPALISLLQNSTATVRETTIVSLSNIAEEAAIPHLIEALADESVVVRKAALQALRRITKQSFGFREEMPVDDERNKRALGKWRAWQMDDLMLLSQLHGRGKITLDRARAAGYDSVEKIRDADPEALSEALELSLTAVRRMIKGGAARIATTPEAPRAEKETPLEKVEVLEDIPGVGEKSAARLRAAGFESPEELSRHDAAEIAERTGLYPGIVTKILAELRPSAPGGGDPGEDGSPDSGR